MVDITARGINLSIRIYEAPEKPSVSTSVDNEEKGDESTNTKKAKSSIASAVSSVPAQRVTLRTKDLLISYTSSAVKGQGKKKVFGSWKSSGKPRLTNRPLIKMSFVGYNTNVGSLLDKSSSRMEHRTWIEILPLQCHLDWPFIDLIKRIAESCKLSSTSSNNNSARSESNSKNSSASDNSNSGGELYFQWIEIKPVDIKIDYEVSLFNLGDFQQGNVFQLLNLLPIEALELTLVQFDLRGISGGAELGLKIAETWVQDIYKNQVHRLLSGTAALRGVSNIGASLHELMMIPLKDYTTSRGLVRDLQKKTTNLVKTVAKETLHVTHKLTMLIARGIAGLTSQPSQNLSLKNHSGNSLSESLMRPSSKLSNNSSFKSKNQPSNLKDGLERAYEAMSREISFFTDTVIAIPVREYQQSGPGGAVTAVIRAMPLAILRPIGGASEAMSYTLLGLRNSIDPVRKQEEEDCWNGEGAPL
jgi:hypothetical protein